MKISLNSPKESLLYLMTLELCVLRVPKNCQAERDLFRQVQGEIVRRYSATSFFFCLHSCAVRRFFFSLSTFRASSRHSLLCCELNDSAIVCGVYIWTVVDTV